MAIPLAEALPLAFRLPTITYWNRLEARPRTSEFSRALKAEVRDPLWTLSRQWQLGEYQGEDAGSAILTRVNLASTRITRWSARGADAVAFAEQPPLETRVEREAVPLDTLTRVQIGQRWIDFLDAHGAAPGTVQLFRDEFHFPAVSSPSIAEADLYSHRRLWQFRAAAAGRTIDGGRLIEQIEGGTAASETTHDGDVIAAADRPKVDAAEEDLLRWYERLFGQLRASEDSAWSPYDLEYRLACSAPDADGGQTVLIADEYAQGRLDWYAFDLDGNPDAALVEKPGEQVDDDVLSEKTLTFIPTEIAFGGMPAVRWWEFEDRRTDFGAIEAETTDLAKLLLAEFTLLYSNDWMVIPYTLPVGALAEVSGLVVVDNFGERTIVRAAGRGDQADWERWNMYTLTRTTGGGADMRLFVPPVVGRIDEGPPIEEVRLFRDEMANMVWAVEATIPDGLSAGRDGYEAAIDYVALVKSLAPPAPPDAAPTKAPVRYVGGTTVPENWIPMIPVHKQGAIRATELRRGAMPRLIGGLPPEPVMPRGEILRPFGQAPYVVGEQEVPKAGARVTRSFQRARGIAGETYLWLGRRKRVGRDAHASGLRFDQAENIVRRENEEGG